MEPEPIIGGLGQGGVRAMRYELNGSLVADAAGVEPPGQDEHALAAFVQQLLGRAIPGPQRREFMESVRHLQDQRPAIAAALCDVIRDGMRDRHIPEINVCLGEEYDFSEEGDGYRLCLPKDDPKAYCHDDDNPDC